MSENEASFNPQDPAHVEKAYHKGLKLLDAIIALIDAKRMYWEKKTLHVGTAHE